MRKNRITLHKVRISPDSDCFRRCFRGAALQLAAGGAGGMSARTALRSRSFQEGSSPSFAPRGPAGSGGTVEPQARLVGHGAGCLGSTGRSGPPARPHLRARTWLWHNSWGRREHPAPLLRASSPRGFSWAFHACLKNKGKPPSFLNISRASMMEMIAFTPAFSGRFQYRAKGGLSQETSGG